MLMQTKEAEAGATLYQILYNFMLFYACYYHTTACLLIPAGWLGPIFFSAHLLDQTISFSPLVPIVLPRGP